MGLKRQTFKYIYILRKRTMEISIEDQLDGDGKVIDQIATVKRDVTTTVTNRQSQTMYLKNKEQLEIKKAEIEKALAEIQEVLDEFTFVLE